MFSFYIVCIGVSAPLKNTRSPLFGQLPSYVCKVPPIFMLSSYILFFVSSFSSPLPAPLKIGFFSDLS